MFNRNNSFAKKQIDSLKEITKNCLTKFTLKNTFRIYYMSQFSKQNTRKIKRGFQLKCIGEIIQESNLNTVTNATHCKKLKKRKQFYQNNIRSIYKVSE